MASDRTETRLEPTAWRRLWPFALVAVVTVVGYAVQHGRYYIHFMDDAWVMSWAYNLVNNGTDADTVFRDGTYTIVFGKALQFIYGSFLEVAGWSRVNALRMSTAFVWLSAGLWYGVARELRWTRERALILAFSMVMLDKIVEAGCLCRAEAMVLAWIGAALFAFARGRYLLAGILATAGAETHPMAITACFYILAWTLAHPQRYLADKRRTAKDVGWFVLGCSIGVGWYAALHWEELASGELVRVLKGSASFAAGKRKEWTYLDRHFKWHSKYELLIFVFAAFAWLQQRLWRDNAFPMLAVVCVVISAFLNKRPNGFYAALAFPAFAVMAVHAFGRAKIARAAFVLLLLSFVYQAHGRYTKYPEYVPGASVPTLQKLVPDDGLPVVGMNDFWFAFPDRPFMPGDYDSNIAARLDSKEWRKVYLIDSSFRSNRYVFSRIKSHLRRNFDAEEIGSFDEHGKHKLTVIRYTRR